MRCRVCDSENVQVFLDLGDQPYANALLERQDQKEEKHPLKLAYCNDCSLVQLTHTADPKELFDKYLWVTATSKVAKEHALRFCFKVMRPGDHTVLEVGSNDGTFLQAFKGNDLYVMGIDPAANLAHYANEHGIPTTCAYFGEKIAKSLEGFFDIVVARNVLPHVANTHSFTEGLKIAVSDGGRVAIEVHYAKKIYQELHYDSVYHEHLCYFSLKSLEKLLNMHGLYVSDISNSPISGGSIIVIASKKKGKTNKSVERYREAEKKIGLNTLEAWNKFALRVAKHREKLLKILPKDGVVGYGASARSSTLLNYCDIKLPVIADANPRKHNLYTAGTRIPIKSPEEVLEANPKYILVLAWNFRQEIMENLGNTYKYIISLPYAPKEI